MSQKIMTTTYSESTQASTITRHCEKPEIVNNRSAQAISKLLIEIINENKEKGLNYKKDCFFSSKIPHLELTKYLERIIKYSQLEESTLIMAVIFLDRLMERKGYAINSHNIHRILFTAITIALKFNEDDNYKNVQYAQIGGISLSDLNLYEIKFLELIDFSLYVSANLFNQYECYLKQLQVTM